MMLWHRRLGHLSTKELVRIHKSGLVDGFKVSGQLHNTNKIMNQSFWIGVQPALTEEMLDYAVTKIENYLGVGF
jgi:dTDP-4-amino-4,6-dideoxygalactose transaminase